MFFLGGGIRRFVAAAGVSDFMLKMQKVKDWRIMDFAQSSG